MSDLSKTNNKTMEIYLKNEEVQKKDGRMTSSTLSTISSLASPGDSGVQMLDSDSELTSVMSSASASETEVGRIFDQDVQQTEPISPHITEIQPLDAGDSPNKEANKTWIEHLDPINQINVIIQEKPSIEKQYEIRRNSQKDEDIRHFHEEIEKTLDDEPLDMEMVNEELDLEISVEGENMLYDKGVFNYYTEAENVKEEENANSMADIQNVVLYQDTELVDVTLDEEETKSDSAPKEHVDTYDPEKEAEDSDNKEIKIPISNTFHQFTESDFVNKNVVDEKFSQSVPNYFDKFSEAASASKYLHESCKSLSDEVFEMEHPIKFNADVDLMNCSLNSYELLDYTLQNTILKVPTEPETIDMHVSMSEEVNENLKVILDGKEAPPPIEEEIPVIENPDSKPAEEQIVFRRQRKKKSKSDTPKKRVSFHEDILNSTKIDDIHINLGFITHEPDVSLSFMQRGFFRKPDVVKGRYSWAAEGDAPYYEKPGNHRETKSDLYINRSRGSSSSSSTTGSTSSSIDEESSESDETAAKKQPTHSKPRSSCLKKTKHKNYIETTIVDEEIDFKKKKSETNLLDTNIFGSLKNILNFSTSVPLAERGVPEGQEDTLYSSSQDLSGRRKSFGHFSFADNTVEVAEVKPEPISQANLAKTNLKLTRSEGFYPNYPNQEIPANIILCDSNVYEHKGISYSYEYDNFQKSFVQQNKPKSSTMYKNILKEFNFFRRKSKEEPDVEPENDFEVIGELSSPTVPDLTIEEVEEVSIIEEPTTNATSTPKSNLSRYASSSKLDWSDNETIISELSETKGQRHLDSPKRKARRNNHYTVGQSPHKVPLSECSTDSLYEAKSLPNLKPSSSKNSLINRFLKNVTLKKMLDVKTERTLKRSRCYMGLYPKGVKIHKDLNHDFDTTIAAEVSSGQANTLKEQRVDKMLGINLRNQIFRNKKEQLLRVFPVRSAYTTIGDSKPLLMILSNRAIYVVSSKQNAVFSTHFVLPYNDLNAILIGPSAQTIHLSNNDLDMQCMLTTGCSKITQELIGQLEIAMRKDANKPKLPAVKTLSMRDMANLRQAICRQTAVEKDEEYFYYSIVNIQDSVSDDTLTPMGPTKEGPLMFKTANGDSGRWETAYFILKAGVLYMLSSVSQRLPMRQFSLMNGACQGARRVFNSHRPHTFQLVVQGNILLLAAPDEYVASEWLQELIHAASGIYSNKEKNATQSCSLLMTSDHVLTVREAFPCTVNSLLPPKSKHEVIESPQALSCAAITDLVAFRLPSAEQSWCVLGPNSVCLWNASNTSLSRHFMQRATCRDGIPQYTEFGPRSVLSVLCRNSEQFVLTCLGILTQVYGFVKCSIIQLPNLLNPKLNRSKEFSCREVHEYSGDWIIYFSTNAELETFISTLEMLWQYGNDNGDSFPLSTIPETDPLSKKCVNIYKSLLDEWPPNTVHLQFL